MATLAELLLQGSEKIRNLPLEVQRVITNPQLFSELLLKKNALPRETGFAAGLTGLEPESLSVMDANQAPYMQGYTEAEPLGIAAMMLPFMGVAGKAAGKTLGPKAGQMAENYISRLGGTANIAPTGPKRQQSAFVPGVNAGDEMIVQHNTTVDKLLGAERLGGMPVPSLGITKIGYDDPLRSFGDITLIGGKDMARPSRANPVYTADAYTVTRPTIYTKTDNKADEIFRKEFSQPYQQFANTTEFRQNMSSILQNPGKNILDSAEARARFMYDNGIMPDLKGQESLYRANRFINEKFSELPDAVKQQFYEYQDGILDSVRAQGGKVDEMLFKGRSDVTGRELYEPATLDRIVKRMAKKGAGSEGNFQSAGSIRGQLAPKFKSIEQIQKARDRIIPEESFENVKAGLLGQHANLLDDLYGVAKQNNKGTDIPSVLEDLTLGRMNQYEYSREFDKLIPEEVKGRAKDYAKALKDAPTGYFEIKPKRAVGIGEFKGALVPSDIDPRAITALERNGVREIYKYASPEEKKSLLQKFGKEMFAGLAVPLAASDDIYSQLDEQLADLKAQREALLKK